MAVGQFWNVPLTSGHGLRRARFSTADALSRAVGLRNAVAHGYGASDATLVRAAATRGVDDLEALAREVAWWAATISRD